MKIIIAIIRIVAMAFVLASFLYVTLNTYSIIISSSKEERRYNDVPFYECLEKSFFHTASLVLLFFLVFLVLRKVVDVVKYRYFIGIVIAASYILSLKIGAGVVKIYDGSVLIELFTVIVFGALMTKVLSKYLPS